MAHDITAAFEVTSWDEHPFDAAIETPKVTEALVGKSYSGDIDGTSSTRWLMSYAPDETATLTVVGGAGGLAGATGSGDFRADPGGSVSLHLD